MLNNASAQTETRNVQAHVRKLVLTSALSPRAGGAVRGKLRGSSDGRFAPNFACKSPLPGLVPGIQCAEHARQLGGASPLSSLMERRISEAQGRRREAGSEG